MLAKQAQLPEFNSYDPYGKGEPNGICVCSQLWGSLARQPKLTVNKRHCFKNQAEYLQMCPMTLTYICTCAYTVPHTSASVLSAHARTHTQNYRI